MIGPEYLAERPMWAQHCAGRRVLGGAIDSSGMVRDGPERGRRGQDRAGRVWAGGMEAAEIW